MSRAVASCDAIFCVSWQVFFYPAIVETSLLWDEPSGLNAQENAV